MRKTFDFQTKIGSASISNIKFDLNSRDEIPKLLFGLQHIYNLVVENQEIYQKISSVLLGIFPNHEATKTGRRGMDLWKILVLGTLRLNCNWDYDKVQEIANQHHNVRLMLGHDENDFDNMYPLQTIKDNVSRLTPDVLDQINLIVVKTAHSELGKQDVVLKGSCDSFVTETNVHYPTDINVLLDAVRKALSMIAVICAKYGITEWRQFNHNLKKIRKKFHKARNLKKSNSKNSKKKAARDKAIVEAHQSYADVVEYFIENVSIAVDILHGMVLLPVDFAYLMLIEKYIMDAKRQIDQIRRRVVNNEKIPHVEKVFSIFEEHTEWISKGKAGVNQELGLRVCVLKDQFGMILHHKVMEKQTDDKVAVEMIVDAKNKFDNLNSCSFDKGFYTPSNKIELDKILDFVVLPKKGRLSVKDKEEEHSEAFKEARRKHSAVESSINALENHGLDRCLDHGIDGFKRYVSLAVLARNIQILGHIIQQKKLNRQKRRNQNRMAA